MQYLYHPFKGENWQQQDSFFQTMNVPTADEVSGGGKKEQKPVSLKVYSFALSPFRSRRKLLPCRCSVCCSSFCSICRRETVGERKRRSKEKNLLLPFSLWRFLLFLGLHEEQAVLHSFLCVKATAVSFSVSLLFCLCVEKIDDFFQGNYRRTTRELPLLMVILDQAASFFRSVSNPCSSWLQSHSHGCCCDSCERSKQDSHPGRHR